MNDPQSTIKSWNWIFIIYLKFRFSEKATKFCEIFPLLLTVCTVVKSKKKIWGRSQTTWTNFWPILTTYLPIVDFRGHLVHYLPLVHVDIEKPDHLPPMYNMYLVLQLLLSRKRWGYNFQVFLGLVTNWINIHNQKLPGDVKNISDLT